MKLRVFSISGFLVEELLLVMAIPAAVAVAVAATAAAVAMVVAVEGVLGLRGGGNEEKGKRSDTIMSYQL